MVILLKLASLFILLILSACNSVVQFNGNDYKNPELSYGGATGTSGSFNSPMTVAPTLLVQKEGPFSCSVTSLPAGLTIDSSSCIISGTPTTASRLQSYQVIATNASGSTSTKVNLQVSPILPVLSFSAATGLKGHVNTVMSVTPTSLSHGGESAVCSSTTLPAGLSIDPSTCVISGTPTVSTKNTSYTVTLTNSAGAVSATVELTTYLFQGIPESGFGNSSGSIQYDITADYNTIKDTVYGMTLQADGKVLIYGHTARVYAYPVDGFISRLNLDGTLDTSFNTNGIHIYNSPSGSRDWIYDVKIFNNKIYAFGAARVDNTVASNRALVFRMNMDGTADTSFGTAGSVFHYTANETAALSRGEVLPDGKMLIFGYHIIASVRQYFIMKLNADGSVDTSFGTAGAYTYPSTNTYTEGKIIVDASNNIYLLMTAGSSADYKTIVVKLTATGVLDPSFGTNGIYTLTYTVKNWSRTMSIIGNEIVLIGQSFADGVTSNEMIVKLDLNGVPISTWGVAGIKDYTSVPGFSDFNMDHAIIHDDQVILAGKRATTFSLMSLDLKTGDMINTFATNSIYQSTMNTPDTGLPALVIDSTRGVLWGAGMTDTLSANSLVHAIKFK